MMKRSRKAALVLMVPATTFLFAGCAEDTQQAMVFSDPGECSTSGYGSGEQCQADFEAAQTLHPEVAPKYLSTEECEADFGAGKCETAPQQTTSGGSVFMPMMMGFLAGQMMNRGAAAGQNLQQQGPAAGSRVPTQPLYKSVDDGSTFRTATNTPVAKGTGLVALKPSQVKPQTGQLVRRGGFGQQAAMRSMAGAGS
jgi:uncharacterized protein YgiB involved in biofilm formation